MACPVPNSPSIIIAPDSPPRSGAGDAAFSFFTSHIYTIRQLINVKNTKNAPEISTPAIVSAVISSSPFVMHRMFSLYNRIRCYRKNVNS